MRTEERKVRYYQFYEIGEMTRAKVLDADKRALEAIKQAQDLIEWLRAHRVELAERYRELEAMESHIRVTLKRHRERTVGMMKDKLIYIATAAVMVLWFIAADYGLTVSGY